MSLASDSRQPCSCVLLHRRDQEPAVGAEDDADMAAGPLQHRLLLGDAGVPERRPAIGGRGEAPALGVEGQVGHGLVVGERRGRRPGSGVADMQRSRPAAKAIRPAPGAGRHAVDPAALDLGQIARRRAGARPDQPPVVAAGDQPSPEGWRTAHSDRAVVGLDDGARPRTHRPSPSANTARPDRVEQGGGDVGVEVDVNSSP